MEKSKEAQVIEYVQEYISWTDAIEQRTREMKALREPVNSRASMNWQQAEAFSKELEFYESQKNNLKAVIDTAKKNIARLAKDIGKIFPVQNVPVHMVVDGRRVFVTYSVDAYGQGHIKVDESI